MLFNSFNFWLVFPFIFVIYWAIPSQCNKCRNWFLLCVSYLLYLNWNPAFAIALFGVTVICYTGGSWIENYDGTRQKKKNLCAFFCILGLLPLLVFKYYNFLNDSISDILSLVGFRFSLPGLNWAIPVGISFFSFQSVGYVLDVYHKRIASENNFLDFALFVSFFPQVTSGPISRFSELMPQIKSMHSFNFQQGVSGLKLLLWGMFFKVVVADRIGLFVDTTYQFYEHYSGLTLFENSIYYSIQIYCDFAGYSMMAVGIAKIMGFDLVNNFNNPYFAVSITNFWKRWHISLTRWLTTHVYINLGGNRCNKYRQYFNIIITFLVSGLWHGANWTFIVWGALHGLFQIVEKHLGLDPKGKYGSIGLAKLKILHPLRIFTTFMLVNFAWIFFRMPSISDATAVVSKIICNPFDGDFHLPGDKFVFFTGLTILFLKELWDEYYRQSMHVHRFFKWCIYIAIFILIIVIGVLDSGQFIYVNF